jgi:hypothetical protein
MLAKFQVIEHEVQESPGYDNSSEQRNQHTQTEVDGETLHHASAKRITKNIQNQAGDQCGCI